MVFTLLPILIFSGKLSEEDSPISKLFAVSPSALKQFVAILQKAFDEKIKNKELIAKAEKIDKKIDA